MAFTRPTLYDIRYTLYEAMRPKSVTVIGWLFVISAGLGLVGALQSFVTIGFIEQYIAPPGALELEIEGEMGQVYGSVLSQMMGLTKHFRLIALGQLALAAVTLVAGINFLLLKAWARAALEAVSWFYLAMFLATAKLWHGVMSGLPSAAGYADILGEEMGSLYEPMITLGRIMPVVMMVTGVAVTLVMIMLLRRTDVRAAMRRPR